MAPRSPHLLRVPRVSLSMATWRHVLSFLSLGDGSTAGVAFQLPMAFIIDLQKLQAAKSYDPEDLKHQLKDPGDSASPLGLTPRNALAFSCREDHQLVNFSSCSASSYFPHHQRFQHGDDDQRVTVQPTVLAAMEASHCDVYVNNNNNGPTGGITATGTAAAAHTKESSEMSSSGSSSSARQIVPHHAPDHDQLQLRKPQSSSSLAKMMQRLTLSSNSNNDSASRRRRRLAPPTQENQHHQRASWPSLRADHQRDSFTRRAQQSLLNAWASIHHRERDTSESLFAPPQFLLRTQRKISQRFNLKIVQAVGKDLRRLESQQRRSSLMMLEVPSSHTSASSTTTATTDTSEESDDEYPLNLSERLSLTLGRRISRDFAPMLTEGSPLECRIREMVYSLLRDPATLEGHVCSSFFAKQEEFTSPQPAACRYYLNRVRETINDLVQFIVEYRLRELDLDFVGTTTLSNQDENADESVGPADDEQLTSAVRRAVEEYFCFSLRYEIRQWSASASNGGNRSRFKYTLAKWSALPASSAEFGLKSHHAQLESHGLLARAISKLHELEVIATPTRKMESLLAACHALSEYIEEQSRAKSFSSSSSSSSLPGMGPQPPPVPLSPTTRVCLGDADAFLPLLIFAVSRSKLRDPFLECAQLQGLFPFASQHGERMYYLTMFEASLEYIRTHS